MTEPSRAGIRIPDFMAAPNLFLTALQSDGWDARLNTTRCKQVSRAWDRQSPSLVICRSEKRNGAIFGEAGEMMSAHTCETEPGADSVIAKKTSDRIDNNSVGLRRCFWKYFPIVSGSRKNFRCDSQSLARSLLCRSAPPGNVSTAMAAPSQVDRQLAT